MGHNQAKEEAKFALAQHGLLRKGSDAKSTGFKIPTSDQLSVKRVDPAMLEVSFLLAGPVYDQLVYCVL